MSLWLETGLQATVLACIHGAPLPVCHLSGPQRRLLPLLTCLSSLACPRLLVEPLQAALVELWTVAFPGGPFPANVKHEQWKELGFQSDVPARDLSR